MVPNVVNGQLSENPTAARGKLTSVWLGGLVNPQALLTVIRREKASLAKVNLEDVCFQIFFSYAYKVITVLQILL